MGGMISHSPRLTQRSKPTTARPDVEDRDRIPDQQNGLRPHGQRADLEQCWVCSLREISE